jgi:hypothetical protein
MSTCTELRNNPKNEIIQISHLTNSLFGKRGNPQTYKSKFSECQVNFSCTSNLCINNKYAQSKKTLSQKAVGANPAKPSVSPSVVVEARVQKGKYTQQHAPGKE